MAMVMPVEPAWALDGGLKSNLAGIRCTGGAVGTCFIGVQDERRRRGKKIFKFIKSKF